MNELINKNHGKRVLFSKGKQRYFLKKVQKKISLNLEKFSKLANVHPRTMTDWKREKFLMSLSALEKICNKAKISQPKNIKINNPFWYTTIGGTIGGKASYKKQGCVGGDPQYRKKKWREWWEREGKFKKYSIIGKSKFINIPPKSSQLAEFVGIILGDGSITNNQVTISCHRFDDKEFANYIKNLSKSLFKITPAIYIEEKNTLVKVVISRKKLIKHLMDMGLNIGSKVRQQTGVPSWILKSRLFTISCLRGLFDTDGCFYIDKHNYKDKTYYNCAMAFTNRSIPLLSFFKNNLESLGFHPTQKTEFTVFLRKENEILKYFSEIKSSNSKHLNKFDKYFKQKYGEVPKWS